MLVKRQSSAKARPPITFNEITGLPTLLLRQGASTRAVIDRPGLLSKLEAGIPLHLNSVNGIITGLLAGLACTLAPRVFVSEHLHSGDLHARPIVSPSLTRKLYVGQLKDRPATRLAEAMVKLLQELIATEVDAGRWDAQLTPS